MDNVIDLPNSDRDPLNPQNMSVAITFPREWLRHIQQVADDALHGGDIHWLKQLMAKISIAAMPRPKEADTIPLTVLTMMFHFAHETEGMSHHDTATTALTTIRELQKMADEETRAAVKQN